jgi:hypothetical protein
VNNTFSIKRFGLLLKKTFLEKPMQMIGFPGLILTLVLILYVLVKALSGFDMAQRISFFVGLAGGSFFLASFVFGYFSSNASGSSFLSLPASHFEKWLCGILIAGIFYPIVFLIFYYGIDTGFVALYHNSLDAASPFYKQDYESVYTFDLNGIIARNVYVLFFIYTGAMLLGSLYFNKVSIIKTAIALCIICLVIYGANWIFASMLFGNIDDAAPFIHVAIPVSNDVGFIELPAGIAKLCKYAFLYVTPASFWLLSFTRLREKEF